MKAPIFAAAITGLLCSTLHTKAQLQAMDSGPHHTRWARNASAKGTNAEEAQPQGGWTQLEPGLNYWDEETSNWKPSKEEIEITPTGAVARHGQHQVRFSSNVNDPEGAIDLLIDNQVRMRSSILAIRYFDPATGQTADVGLVKDCIGELLPPNQILYRNAFAGIEADVLYTYRKGEFEADVILREVPPSPEELGLQQVSDAARLEVLTEFFEAPAPQKTVHLLATVEDPQLRAQVAEPDWTDEELNFGPNRFGQGRAFAWSAREAAGARPESFPAVAKKWIELGAGRALLIEAVEYASLFDELVLLPGKQDRIDSLRKAREAWAKLPSTSRRLSGLQQWARAYAKDSRRSTDNWATIPARPSVSTGQPRRWPMLLATSPSNSKIPGVVIDWTSVPVGYTTYTFRADETYHITGNCFFGGTTTLEAGTVLKFQRTTNVWTGVTLTGPFLCKTTPYQPAVFTTEDDNSIGEPIQPGQPSILNNYASVPLRFFDTGQPVLVENIRVKHAVHGIRFQGNNPSNVVRHAQFIDCNFPVSNNTNTPVRLQNVLISNVRSYGSVFYGTNSPSPTPFIGEHVTIHNAQHLLQIGGSVFLTNSLIIGVTNVQAYSGSGNFQAPTPVGVFEALGAASSYLPVGSPHRNSGITTIDPYLIQALYSRTTQAPLLLTGTIHLPTTLLPTTALDTAVPDRGYHYDSIDYCVANLSITNASLTLAPGVVVAVYGTNGFKLLKSSRLIANGSASRPCIITRYNTVQEQTAIWGAPATNQFRVISVDAPSATGTNVPALILRHARITLPAAFTNSVSTRELVGLDGASMLHPFDISDCQLSGISIRVANPVSIRPAISWTNSVFERCWIVLEDQAGQNILDASIYNSLFSGSRVQLSNLHATGSWKLHDNLFLSSALNPAGTIVASHNAFGTGVPILGTNARTNILSDFLVGPRGRFYYPAVGPSNSLASLTDKGSRTSDTAGLFHFTTRIDQRKETNSVVDIGFHYPATGTPAAGLIASYDFEEGSGTTTSDGSGNGNNGVLYNGTLWTNGRNGNAVAFDGFNDYVAVPDVPSLRLTNAFSLAVWVRKFSEAAYWQPYILKQTNLLSRNYWLGDWESTSGVATSGYVDSSGTQRNTSSMSHILPGLWTHLTWTWDGTTQRMYVNGSLEGTNPSSAFIPNTSTAPLSIGGYHYASSSMHGVLDEVRIYNRALSQQEILGLQSNSPADTDGDGVEDTYEDLNGNGLVDSGESNWTNSNTGLTLPSALQIHTPLR